MRVRRPSRGDQLSGDRLRSDRLRSDQLRDDRGRDSTTPHSTTPNSTTPQVEDVLDPDLLRDEMVDDDYLREFFREQQLRPDADNHDSLRQYLPPPRSHSVRDAEPPVDRETPLARRSKLVGLVVAGALLSGSVVAAAVTAEQTDLAATTTQGTDPTLEITGVAALGGFAAPKPEGAAPEPTAPPSASSSAPGPVAAPQPGGPAAVPAPQPGNGAPAAPAVEQSTTGTTGSGGGSRALGAPGIVDHVQFVHEFYRRVAATPQDALRLLAPAFTGEEPEELVRTWTSMREITLMDAEQRPDGSVTAVVTMSHPLEGDLRVTQSLGFTDQPTLLISQARVLSSQHT